MDVDRREKTRCRLLKAGFSYAFQHPTKCRATGDMLSGPDTTSILELSKATRFWGCDGDGVSARQRTMVLLISFLNFRPYLVEISSERTRSRTRKGTCQFNKDRDRAQMPGATRECVASLGLWCGVNLQPHHHHAAHSGSLLRPPMGSRPRRGPPPVWPSAQSGIGDMLTQTRLDIDFLGIKRAAGNRHRCKRRKSQSDGHTMHRRERLPRFAWRQQSTTTGARRKAMMASASLGWNRQSLAALEGGACIGNVRMFPPSVP